MSETHKNNIEILENKIAQALTELESCDYHENNDKYNYWNNKHIIHSSQLEIYKTAMYEAPLAKSSYDVIH